MERDRTLSGDLFILASMAMFGSFPLFLRFYPQISPLVFLGAFQVAGVIGFFIITYFQGTPQLTKRDYTLFVTLAVVALLNDFCYFFALTMTSVANAAIAHQSVSIFLLLLAPLLLGERTHKSEWIALGFALCGIAVLYSDQLGVDMTRRSFVGITLGVLSGLFYALLIILYRVIPDKDRGVTISVTNFCRYAISCVFLLPVIPWMNLPGLQGRDFFPLIIFGFAFAVVATLIHTYGINKARPLHSSILGKSEPVFAIIYAALFLRELPTARAIIGGSLIVGSSLWLALKKEK